VPDVIFYPTGGGTEIIGMRKAVAELSRTASNTRSAGRTRIPFAAGVRVPRAVGDF
jgi:hypothetical protein